MQKRRNKHVGLKNDLLFLLILWIYTVKVGVIDFSMYLKNDIDDYRSEERYSLLPFSSLFILFFFFERDAQIVLCLFPWQQKQPDSIHFRSEELRGGTEPTAEVGLLDYFKTLPVGGKTILNICSISATIINAYSKKEKMYWNCSNQMFCFCAVPPFTVFRAELTL